MATPPTSDWFEYRKYIVSTLEKQSEELEAIRDQMVLLRIDLAMLKVRSGVWGAVAGSIPAAIAVLAVLTGVPGG